MLVQPRKIELVDEPELKAPPGGFVVRVRAALTDGTDLKAFRRGHPQMPMPTKFGHEFSGDIIAIGETTTPWAVGDAIMCVHSAPCGSCSWCVRREEELCESVMSTKILGAYAECIVVPAHIAAVNCFHKPSEMSYEVAAFLEPLACVVHSVSYSSAKPYDVAVILGDGGFGLLHAEVLRARGVQVLLAGRRPERLEIARSFGLSRVIDTRTESIDDALAEQTDGRGADLVFECTGSEEVWERSLRYARRGGKVVFFGGLPSSSTVSFLASRLHYDEVKLLSPFHFTPRDVRLAYDLLSDGLIRVAPLLTAHYSLDAITQAFADLDAGRGVKYAILP